MKEGGFILVDGRLATDISVMDRGLQYGDGVFRTLKAEAGALLWWEDHYRKLAEDCAALQLACPAESLLLDEARTAASQPGVGVVKIIITRGSGRRGYAAPEHSRSSRVVMGFAAANRQTDVQLRWCSLRLSAQPRLAGIKHLNRLENVLARSEWQNTDIAEGLLLNQAGQVIGGTMSNVFLLERGGLVTPDLSQSGIAGVARARLIRAADRHGIAVSVEAVSPARLLAADEIFLTNSLIGVWRARSLENQNWPDTGMRAKLVNWLYEENWQQNKT